MTEENNVAILAEKLDISLHELLSYLKKANINKKSKDTLSIKDKVELLKYFKEINKEDNKDSNQVSSKSDKSEEPPKRKVLSLRKKITLGDSSAKKHSSVGVKKVKTRSLSQKPLLSSEIFDDLKKEVDKIREKQQVIKAQEEKLKAEQEKLIAKSHQQEKEQEQDKKQTETTDDSVKESKKPAKITKQVDATLSKEEVSKDHKSQKSSKKTSKGKKSPPTANNNYAAHKVSDISSILERDANDEDKKLKKSTPASQAVHRVVSETKHKFNKPVKPVSITVEIPASIAVSDLAKKLSVKAHVIIKELMKLGVKANINQSLEQDTAILVAEELGHQASAASSDTKEHLLHQEIAEQQKEIKPRAPIVTIMGHVDHGKTSLLDYIRKTKVVAKEAGGITQHIGAYQVNFDDHLITFLDTPGHEAFSAMRSRGADCTDIVILVVAADDGVKPQTIEAIQHAKAAKVPLIVAINKIDKPDIDLERVRVELSQHEVISEDWGGDTQFIKVSAKEGTGIDDLLSAISVQAEILELKAPTKGPAEGVIIESRLEKGRGVIATALIQKGELKKSNIVLIGTEYGRIRAMIDDTGKMLTHATPSMPVELLGLSGVPHAGDELLVVPDEKAARAIITERQEIKNKEKSVSTEEDKFALLMKKVSTGDQKEVNLIVKADVAGSVEALVDSLVKLSDEKVKVKVIGRGVGGINESDITLAMAANAVIIGFNVRADNKAKKLAERELVTINYYSIIYNIIDDVNNMKRGLVTPEYKEKILGLAEVKSVFRSSKFGPIAGCIVTEGTIKKANPIRVLRDSVVIYEGELESLRRFKDDVSEVNSGTECGIGVKNYNDVKAGDIIEVFERVKVDAY